MGSQVSAKTNDKEQQLKKASKMAMVRALLPIVGLVVIFLLFNVLTDFRMMGNMSLAFSQVYVTMIAAMVISDLQRLEKVYPDEAAFFRPPLLSVFSLPV